VAQNNNQIYLNKAIDYIVQNFTAPPNLEEAAKVSGFSKFHFHRLFKEFTGETLNQFIKRIRLEKAAFFLLFHKERTITDIALSCGFSSSQQFATAFKKYFNTTPKLYKQNKACQGVIIHEPKQIAKYDIQIVYIDKIVIAYKRCFDRYTNEVFNKKRDEIISNYPNKQYIGVFWDDPTISKSDKYRYDYGYILDDNKEQNNLEIQTIEENRYIVLSLKIDKLDTINSVDIWDYLYTNWIPRHSYIPNTLFCFESIQNNTISFYLPIQKI
jgi:AraC family transcriptional regulator